MMSKRTAGLVLALGIAVLPASGWRFVSMGDSRGSSQRSPYPPTAFTYVVGYIAGLNPRPDLVLFSGDAFYGYTDVIDSMRLEWQDWKQRVQPITDLGIPVYPTVGNHEANTDGQLDGGAVFAEQWPNLPGNGPAGLVHQAYAFRHENAEFFCLNSDIYNDASRIGANQRDWMQSVLDTSTALLDFAFAHEPAFPDDPAGSSSLQRYRADRNAFWAVLSQYHFVAYICGHLHEWNRDFFQWRNYPTDTTVHQVIDGTCGAPIYHGNGGEFYHFVVWDIDSNRVSGHVYDNYNTLRDSFVYYGRNGIEEPAAPPLALPVMQVEPNPSTGRTVVRVRPLSPDSRLTVYDGAGRPVRVLAPQTLPPGPGSLVWDGRDASGRPQPSGVYLLVLSSGSARSVTTVTIVR